MRVWCNVVLAVAVAALVAGPTRAQFGGRGGFGGGPGMLLQNKGVQKELKLSEEELDKIKKTATDLQAKYKDEFEALGKLQGDERREKGQEVFKKYNEDSQKVYGEIVSSLKEDQQKRLKQIGIQIRGPMAFADPEVQKTLNLTDEQKDKLKEIGEEARASFGEVGPLFQQGKFEEGQKKMAELNKALLEKITGLLNDEQKTAWKEMTGAHFEFKFEGPPRRRPQTNNQG